MVNAALRLGRWTAFLTLGLTLGGLSQGCAALGACDTSDDSNPADRYEDGTAQGGVYMSSPWKGPLLAFPGGKRYDLVHHLGCTPRAVSVWVSFSEDGIGNASIAQSAGNMSIVQDINEQTIRIKNDSCSDYFLLVTAFCEASGAGAADAGPDNADSSPDGGTDAGADASSTD